MATFGTKYIHCAMWTKDEGTLLNNKGLKGDRDPNGSRMAIMQNIVFFSDVFFGIAGQIFCQKY